MLSLRSHAAMLFVALLSTAVPAQARQAWRLGPDVHSPRHPTLPSIQLHTNQPLPVLDLYDSGDLAGTPAGRLDAVGLHLDGRLLCRWYEFGDGHRLLGQVPRSSTRDSGCPTHLPFQTKFTGGGFGPPYLFIAIAKLATGRAQVRLGSRRVSFDTTTLPGWPGSWDTPPAALRRDGGPGVGWLESQRTHDRREGEALAAQLRDPAVARFYHGIRRCLMGRTPRCLVQYLHPTFTFTPWWDPENRRVEREEFPQFIWRKSGTEAETIWAELAWCFLRGRFAPGPDGMTFWRGLFYCQVAKFDGSYGVQECGVVE